MADEQQVTVSANLPAPIVIAPEAPNHPPSMSHLSESDRVSLIERRRESVLHLLSHSVKTDARKYTCYIFALLHVLFITQGRRGRDTDHNY